MKVGVRKLEHLGCPCPVVETAWSYDY